MSVSPASKSDLRSRPDRESTFAIRAALALTVLLTLFRFIYAAHLGMAEDETYYWQWSRHLAASYYDQGPGIAYTIKLGTLLFGNTVLGIRTPTVLFGAATGWLMFLTVRRWTGRALPALWTLILLNVAPLIAAGSILATYDGPQVCCWAAALWALTWTLQSNRTAGWYVVGVLTGLGILCKLTMLLFAPGVLVFLLWSPTYRRWLATPHPYAAFAIALLLFAPIVAWNATHGWMGFLHTYTLGSRSRNAAPFHWFGDFLGGQCVAVGPFLFLAELIVVGSLCTPRLPRWWTDSDDARRFLIAFVAPTLAICLVDSLKSKLEINWPAPAHLAGLALIGIYFDYLWQRGRAGGRILVLFATGFSLIGTLVAFFPQFLTLVVHPVPSQTAQKLNQTYGWEQIAIRIQAERESLAAEGKPVFVSGINYRTNSVMAFYLPDHPQTQALYLNSRRDQYVVWTHPKTLIGQNAILCLDDKNPDAIAVADSIFDSVTLVETVDIQRPGFDGSVKRWEIYACRGFKGYDVDRYTQGY